MFMSILELKEQKSKIVKIKNKILFFKQIFIRYHSQVQYDNDILGEIQGIDRRYS